MENLLANLYIVLTCLWACIILLFIALSILTTKYNRLKFKLDKLNEEFYKLKIKYEEKEK